MKKVPAQHIGHNAMFFDVTFMNDVFGRLQANSHDPVAAMPMQAGLIQEELDELKDAVAKITTRDESGALAPSTEEFNEIRDAIADILVVTLGAAAILGYDVSHDMQMVFESNMSKLVKNEADWEATKAKYAAIGVEVELRGSFPVAYALVAKTVTINGKVYPKGKFMKSVTFVDPDLSEIVPLHGEGGSYHTLANAMLAQNAKQTAEV